MHWLTHHLRSGFQAISALRHPAAAPGAAGAPSEHGIEAIREAMLALMGGIDDRQSQHVTRRIRYAMDAQALWYLRGDLMAVLAGRDGEAVARQEIEAITKMFEDTLPRGLKSRPSPLSSSSRE